MPKHYRPAVRPRQPLCFIFFNVSSDRSEYDCALGKEEGGELGEVHDQDKGGSLPASQSPHIQVKDVFLKFLIVIVSSVVVHCIG